MLISTKPKNDTERAILERSRQLTDFKWTPVRDVPTYIMKEGNTFIPEGIEVTGFPYASEVRNDKFFCENVSFETFLTSIKNPYSKLYQPGHAAYNASNYGIVCNGLVRYAFGIPYRVSTAKWYTIPGMREIKKRGEYTVDELCLCDILYAFGEGRNHVALITDILRRENGEIAEVEVSEAVRPHCKRRRFTPEDFYDKYSLFGICRYDRMDLVPPLDTETGDLLWKSGLEKVSQRITVDNGNKSNYLEGEEIIISAIGESDTVQIFKDGELIEELPIKVKAVIPRTLSRGYYTVKLKDGGDSAEFCVNAPSVRYTLNAGGSITVYADACDKNSEIAYMDFRIKGTNCSSLAKYEELTDEEKNSGVITRDIPSSGENFKVYFKNRYGIWTHPMIPIVEKADEEN